MSEATWLLTPLKQGGHNFKEAAEFGRWVPIGGTLGELGRALEVDEKAKVDVVRSTPDPWSQARSFADAVLSPSTLLHQKLAQWRGLIALFALSANYENAYRIELIPVPLGQRSSRFAEVMKHLLPQSSVPAPADSVSHGWDRPVIIRLFEIDSQRRKVGKGHDLGLLNPASLVALGRDADRLALPAVPWMKRGITDPLSLTGLEALPAAPLHILATYLDALEQKLDLLCGGGRGTKDDQALLGNLRKQCQLFAADCRAALSTLGADVNLPELESGDLSAEGLPELYKLLATPIKAKPPAPGSSQCIIRLRDDTGERPPFKGFVLLDAALASHQRPANSIRFWGLRMLQEALDSTPAELAALRSEIAEAGFLLVRPEDIFTDVLVQLDESEHKGRIAAHKNGLAEFLIPLSPLALLIRKPDELSDVVAISNEGRVTLKVMLDGQPYQLARRYSDAPKVGEGKLMREADWGLGDFAIWPDFRSDVWKHYLARIDYASATTNRLRGRFAMSGRLLADLLREVQSNEDRARLSQIWSDSSPIDNQGTNSVLDRIPEYSGRSCNKQGLARLRGSNSGGRVSEVQTSSHAFEAAFFTIALGGDQHPVPAGLSLLTLPERNNPNDQIGQVAIDFGTTNTVACLNDTNPIRFKSRLVHPINGAQELAGARAFELTQKFRDFMPCDQRELPSPSVVISRQLDTLGRELLESDRDLNDVLMMRHLVYFQPDFAEDGTISAVPIQEWSSLLNSIKYNLKWSRSPEMRDISRRYLRQLMLMIACEWVDQNGHPSNLRWNFSRPKDMGDNSDFMAELEGALRGTVSNADPKWIQPIVFEGDAAAAYILDEKIKGAGTRGAVNIILDIGGGTTDIAVWDNSSEPKQLLSTSMRLAGGDFFTSHIMANPEILDDFGLRAWAGVISQLNQQPNGDLRDNLRYIGELLFSGKTLDNAIQREWSRVSGTDNVRVLKETAFVFLGGLAWFVGRHLRNLINDGKIKQDTLGDIAAAFCGRGSGLFARLHGKDPRAQTAISKIMLLIAVAAGDTRPKFPQVQVSPVPKIEVAAGMIIANGRRTSADPTSPMANESGIDFGDLGVGGSTDLGPDRPAHAEFTSAKLDVGIEDLDNFLSAFAKVAGFSIALDEAQRAKLLNGIADIDRADIRDGRVQQSEFSAMLKVLVGFMRLRPGDPLRPKTVWNG